MQILIRGKICDLTLASEWTLIQEDALYADFEAILAEYPSKEPHWQDEKDYIVARISLKKDENRSVESAYMLLLREVPHGDHEELLVVNLTPEDAVTKLFVAQ